ncbi:MAG: hypothetical protein QOJ29_716 [Thermoleophilaceae bacterium]|nr:hypothetical protein [Thermoleophilaceae bacterium]
MDESGDFRANSRGLFVGVFLRPSERDELVDRYRSWEQRVRRNLGLKNELKGHSVNDSAAKRLFRDVLAYESQFRVRYLAFAVDVDDDNLRGMEAQRQFFLEDYGSWADQLRADDETKRVAWVEQHAEWCRHVPPTQLLKLVTLGSIIPTLVEHALPMATLGGYDEELEHLQVLIDRGYVKQDDLPRWRELLRNAFINETGTHPWAFLDTWTEDHPFLRKFIESRSDDGPTRMKAAWREAIDFHDSVATPEIRIADVLASIIYRATMHGEKLRSYEMIRGLSIDPASPYRLFKWTTNRRSPMMNPYLALPKKEN